MRSITMILCLCFMSAPSDAQTITHKKNITSKQATLKSQISHKDIQCVAETIYSEARGESLTGQLAVGATIVTRSKKIFHKPVCSIIYQQYTRRKIPLKDRQEYMLLASNILLGNVKNPVGNLDSFDSFKHRYSKRPKRSVKIGNHYFYRSLKEVA